MGSLVAKLLKPSISRRILMLGLDSAGKTTILYKLKLNENVHTIPTIGFNVEEVKVGTGLTFTIWDVGGQEKIRPLWRYYFSNCSALVFVLDSSDEERIGDARKELLSIMSMEEMDGVPVIILANKQDLPNAMTAAEIIEGLNVKLFETSHKWHLQCCCAVSGDGLCEAMKQVCRLSTDYLKRMEKGKC